jgi:hypothetical protein
MTSIALLVSVLATTGSSTAMAAATPRGWQVTTLADRPLTWAAPKGWRLSRELPSDVPPASLSFQGKTPDRADGWLKVQALVTGNRSPEELLATRPIALAHVTTRDGWTCGEEVATGAAVVCMNADALVTTVVELGSDSGRSVWEMGGVETVRRVAPLFKGVWPKGLPHPDAFGHLPATEWSAAGGADGRVAWVAPKGWRTVESTATAPVNALSFNASAGAGEFSIAALPGAGDLEAAQLPTAEAGLISFLMTGATTTRVDGWSCGEGIEKSTGLPAIVCDKLTEDAGLSVSVRAEPAVFATLGGVAAVRAAARQIKGVVY